MYLTYTHLLILQDTLQRGEKYIPHADRIHILNKIANEIDVILSDAKACGEDQ